MNADKPDVIEQACRAYLNRGVTDPVASIQGAMRDAIRVVLADMYEEQGRRSILVYAASMGINLADPSEPPLGGES